MALNIPFLYFFFVVYYFYYVIKWIRQMKTVASKANIGDPS